MRLLLIGGTWFLGRVLAESALQRGWSVTCFNRGKTGRDVPGVRSIRGDRFDPASLDALAAQGGWDAVIDTSVYEPPEAASMAQALRSVAARYALVSTVSAYRHWPEQPCEEASPLWPSRPDARESDPDVQALPRPFRYGTLKSGCEQAVLDVFGDDTLIVRPGVILGPHEYVGRLQALLRRAKRGGQILAAGSPDQPIQPVDVRDLAAFLLDQLATGRTGTYNITAPSGHATYGDLLTGCVTAVGADAELVWVDAQWLLDQGVKEWTQLPLWRTPQGTWRVDSRKAQQAGLRCRPLTETIIDTWRALQAEPLVDHERQREHGLPAEQERELLQAWQAASGASVC
ncbi:NAD-dependent epimerase/dehydratase family protein [Longispora fulva]|uniref:Nucleoside-diphosphate-sugar epimerase n=1 Tax=Longispora fulva TaxID=619741 RepID=A0A8J7KP93_9ACTN|nr:NAD-dependent epimerase/dehydratase family protein [Longispora fulva]MBG6136047.1 nucleoside-diphosphate-sugar epimerase [Longispora fulva]